MKKFRINYYDIEGFLYDEIVICKNFECAENYAIKSIEKRIERARENFENILCPNYSIETLEN